MEKKYIKANLVDDNTMPIIAEVSKMSQHRYHDEFEGPYAYYWKGKDLVTGTPLIFECDEDNFRNEVSKYGVARMTRLGAKQVESLSKVDISILMKIMNDDYLKFYIDTINRAKEHHNNQVKDYIMDRITIRQSIIRDEIELEKNRIKVKRLAKKLMKIDK